MPVKSFVLAKKAFSTFKACNCVARV